MPAETRQRDQYGSGPDRGVRRDEHGERHPESYREKLELG